MARLASPKLAGLLPHTSRCGLLCVQRWDGREPTLNSARLLRGEEAWFFYARILVLMDLRDTTPLMRRLTLGLLS